MFSTPGAENSPRTLAFAKRAGLGVFAFLLAAGGVRLLANQQQADQLQQRTAESLKRSVIAVRPKSGEAARKISLPASLKGNAETPIYARSNGYVSAWHKTIGDVVKKGELLATIDVPELEHELGQARAQRDLAKSRLDLAQATLKRWDVLRKTDSAAPQEYEEKHSAALQAKADLEGAEANLKRLEQMEGYRRIVAPVPGVITRRNVDVGNLINGSQELFALTQTDPLRLTIWVPQTYADDVKVGQEVNVRFPEAQGKTVPARIGHVAGALDPVNRSRQVDISLPNKAGKLLPGAYAEVGFSVAGKSKALIVPANVLVVDGAGTHVVAVDTESRIDFRPVKLGRDFGREVEVLEGVSAADVLVASPSDLLAAGEVVKPVEAEQKAEIRGAEKPKAADISGAGSEAKPKS
ncbi:MAG: efflux RND transporter periplasmic adaptor subunit [Methylococcaceae bacterium]|nr:efflux RND transporter periplasmic adaptor subunit [Methylococcaceae bacterium]